MGLQRADLGAGRGKSHPHPRARLLQPRASRTDLASGQQIDHRTSREKLVAQRRWNDKYFWQGRSRTPGDG
ncbi:hypothetical protein [Cypionkella sp.]|uniref:hypothetical protein n=1 Tax=Cypionkella sp. TaxID=2811411 RepID=UPI00271898E0|nr:hypothetical protein [Cypionkella sp.]MDO8983358.1 hypothetical protein [Cypionkella sp.]MDP2050202.1 hypothetical protein [Cypionkella sp.]